MTQSIAEGAVSKSCKIDTEQVNPGNSSKRIGLNRWSFTAAITAYSPARAMGTARREPMHPRSASSGVWEKVTNRGWLASGLTLAGRGGAGRPCKWAITTSKQ
eukprot:CAMPEP_0204285310 /NCGR_PEP_ID=MMETSP0468-20130131/50360_1 /ASSEMBLY_ACC=CAM_ASM_000383 /TAXON_ID=2969 /ORGANISM="Oxyrrhis marina" /LENGTH=102 /DNA_ID=CAMNT_0051263133 /DNA_START=190 /DNA_END=498 /DNA_ORIENTATION=+